MDKLSYSLGISVGQNLNNLNVDFLQIDDFSQGVSDTISNKKTVIPLEEAAELINNFLKQKQQEEKKQAEDEMKNIKTEGEKFLKKVSRRKGVSTTVSGLMYQVIKEGTGNQPGPHSRVQCHYEGTFSDGQKFDSSYDRGTPSTFSLDQVIPGWTEGLQLMKEGSVYQFYIPYQLGYGERGIPGTVPPYSVLVFKVELIKVV